MDVPDYTGFPARQAIHFPYDSKSALINPGGAATAVEALDLATLPSSHSLDDASPNPFNPEATIRFSLPQDEQVVLQVFNLQGQLVKTLHQGHVAAGTYQSVWDGTDETGASMASGVYLYNLQAGRFSQTKKMTLLK